MHRKLPSRLEPKTAEPRALSPRAAAHVPAYAAVLAAARSQALRALLVIAPLGALAGTVTACGAAAPVRPDPYHQYDPTRPHEATSAVPSVEPIAPPATSSSAPPHTDTPKPQAM
jgi:hypothetical protein